jgi:hypothetical protein
MRLLFSALTLLFLLNATAMACPGQTGKVIFEDTFTDDSGGWQLGAPDSEIKDGSLWLRPNPRGMTEKGRNINSTVRTFSATDGDYCVEFIVPKPVAADNDFMTGLVFWQSSSTDEYLWAVYTDGTTQLNKLAANKWTRIFSDNTGKLEPGSTASLRVIAKDGKLTLFVGSKQVKVIRAQTPTGDLNFGVLAEVEKLSDANPVLQVKSFKVTTGE